MKKRIGCIIIALIIVLSLALPGLAYAGDSEKAYDEGYATGYQDGLAGRDYNAEQGPKTVSSSYWVDYFGGYSEGYGAGQLAKLEKDTKDWDEKFKGMMGDTGYDDSDLQKYLARFDKVKDGPKDGWGYDDWKLWLDYLYEQWMYYASDEEMLDAMLVRQEGLKLYKAWLDSLPLEEQLRIKQHETQKILEEIEIFAEIQRIEDAKAAAAAKAAARL